MQEKFWVVNKGIFTIRMCIFLPVGKLFIYHHQEVKQGNFGKNVLDVGNKPNEINGRYAKTY